MSRVEARLQFSKLFLIFLSLIDVEVNLLLNVKFHVGISIEKEEMVNNSIYDIFYLIYIYNEFTTRYQHDDSLKKGKHFNKRRASLKKCL